RAAWVDVRPLRRTRAPTPGKPAPRPRQATTQRAFLACDHLPPLAGVKLVRPRPRPDGAPAAGADTSTLRSEGLPWGTLRALVLRGLNGDGVPGGQPWRPDAQEVVVL